MAGSNRRGQDPGRLPKPAGIKAPARVKAANGSDVFHLKVTILSNHNDSRKVQDQILEDIERKGFNHQAAFAIKLALEEAMVNAVKHGNKLDPNKHVFIETKITPKTAEIVIEDEGPGFERHHVPDPTLEENLEKCSGRGILLIEAYMDSTEWTKGGRRLRMTKKNAPDTFPR